MRSNDGNGDGAEEMSSIYLWGQPFCQAICQCMIQSCGESTREIDVQNFKREKLARAKYKTSKILVRLKVVDFRS